MLVGPRLTFRAVRVMAPLCALALASCDGVFGLDPVHPQGTPDAGTAARGPDAHGSCGADLLHNGSFDDADMGWTTVPETQVDILRDDDAALTPQAVAPQSPRYLTRLGGDKSYLVTWVEQNVLVPVDARALTVSGYLLLRTDETPDEVYDIARIELGIDPSPRPAVVWSNLTEAAGWTPFSASVDVADLAGQSIVFRIYAQLDGNTPSYFFFDTVALRVSACGP